MIELSDFFIDIIQETSQFNYISPHILTYLTINAALRLVEEYYILRTGFGGHCYGMASASASYKIWPDTKPVVGDTFKMSREAVKSDINNRHWLQLLQLVGMDLHGETYSASVEYNKILTEISYEDRPVVIVLTSSDESGGHAVVAYKILDIAENEKRVYVYDPNYPYDDPNDEVYVEHEKVRDYYIKFDPTSDDKISFHSGGTESYNRAYAIMPDQYSPASTPDSLRDLLKSLFLDLWTKKKMSFGVHSPVRCLFTDEFGRRIGYSDEIFVNEIPGAEMEPLFDSEYFYLPTNLTYAVDMTGTDTGVATFDLNLPTSESQARIVLFEDIPFTLGTHGSMLLSATSLNYAIEFDSGTVYLPDTIGDLDAQLLEYSLPATIDFNPHTLNLKSNGKWVTVRIELPLMNNGSVTDIDLESITLNGEIYAATHPTSIGDYDQDGIPDLMVKFDRSLVCDLVEALLESQEGDMVTLVISGQLADGTLFKGEVTIRVIHK